MTKVFPAKYSQPISLEGELLATPDRQHGRENTRRDRHQLRRQRSNIPGLLFDSLLLLDATMDDGEVVDTGDGARRQSPLDPYLLDALLSVDEKQEKQLISQPKNIGTSF